MHRNRCLIPLSCIDAAMLFRCHSRIAGHANALIYNPSQIIQSDWFRHPDFVSHFPGHVLRVRFELTKPFRALD